MTGRKPERETLQKLLDSPSAEFLAVTGRRRVGKTYLIDTFYGEHFCFSMTGIQDEPTDKQLVNFAVRLAQVDGSGEPKVPKDWQWAFIRLRQYLETLPKHTKRVLFFDELPWIAASDRSFVQLLAHFWNDYLSKQQHFILVICGSATAWITQKILGDPGGMHNRVTEHLHLHAFTLRETREYLNARRIDLTDTDVARVYMALGGIPYYLNGLRRGDSFVTAIERLCFGPTGTLRREYQNLFAALFRNPATHEAIIATLAKHAGGLSRAALTKTASLRSNSATGAALKELVASDFIRLDAAPGFKKRGARYRLTDEYCLFYHRFMTGPETGFNWSRTVQTPRYNSWAGNAFELLCRKHLHGIQHSLGISGMANWAGPLHLPPGEDERGAQIDLLIDRPDATVNLCEMKFYATAYAMTKDAALELLRKQRLVRAYYKDKKQVVITLVTNLEPDRNKWYGQVVDKLVTLNDLLD